MLVGGHSANGVDAAHKLVELPATQSRNGCRIAFAGFEIFGGKAFVDIRFQFNIGTPALGCHCIIARLRKGRAAAPCNVENTHFDVGGLGLCRESEAGAQQYECCSFGGVHVVSGNFGLFL